MIAFEFFLYGNCSVRKNKNSKLPSNLLYIQYCVCIIECTNDFIMEDFFSIMQDVLIFQEISTWECIRCGKQHFHLSKIHGIVVNSCKSVSFPWLLFIHAGNLSGELKRERSGSPQATQYEVRHKFRIVEKLRLTCYCTPQNCK